MPFINSDWLFLYVFVVIILAIILSAAFLKWRAGHRTENLPVTKKAVKMSYTLKNNLLELDKLRQIAEELESFDVPIKIIFDANLALEEIFSNITNYAYEDNNEHLIIIGVSLMENELVLTVEDDGKYFDPLSAPKPDLSKPLEEISLEGLGIQIVRGLMDEIAYERKEDKNILVLRKKLA